jgi:hypothetical protein
MFSNFQGSYIHDYDFHIMLFQGASFVFLWLRFLFHNQLVEEINSDASNGKRLYEHLP